MIQSISNQTIIAKNIFHEHLNLTMLILFVKCSIKKKIKKKERN